LRDGYRMCITGVVKPATTISHPPQAGARGEGAGAPWTFLTNHAHVLVCVASGRGLTVEEIARRVGVTERSARRIIGELEEEGYLARERVGRNNHYALDRSRPLRHPLERHRDVGALLALAAGPRRRAG
jgi:DNA-binding transcriptional ArsR family regulator